MELWETKAGDFADGKFMMHGPKRVIVLVVGQGGKERYNLGGGDNYCQSGIVESKIA